MLGWQLRFITGSVFLLLSFTFTVLEQGTDVELIVLKFFFGVGGWGCGAGGGVIFQILFSHYVTLA